MPRVAVGREHDTTVELYYEDHGRGEPVVLIHGWPLSSRAWEPQVQALVEAGKRVVTYDRRGFGESSRPWSGYDYDTLAADLHTMMEHLDLRAATLVGFSMGGGEVVRYLSKYGDARVAKAVLAAAVPPYLYRADDNPEGGLDDDAIGELEEAVRTDRPGFLDGFVTNFFSTGDRTDLLSQPAKDYHRTIAFLASPKGTLDCIAAWGRTDFRADLEAIEVPTLVLHGTGDAIVPFEVSGKRSHEMLADSELTLIEGGPHGLNATHTEEFNRALLDFIGD